jgi:uncharacterized protein YjbI with pentapeptide repeats
MTNRSQTEILKHGADIWNEWREAHPTVEIDLRNAILSGHDLSLVNLGNVDLRGSRFRNSYLEGANFKKSNLERANFSDSDLTKADFRGSNLGEADFTRAILNHANFARSVIGWANFGNTDLSETLGLDEVEHMGSSYIDTQTLECFKGVIPESFLRGCGLTDWEIEYAKLYNPDLNNEGIVKIQYQMFDLRASQALQISPLFISYSHADKEFVDHIDISLTEKGVRFWRDIHDAKAGRLETQIDRAIRQNPTVLLVLSKNSLNSDWVEHEIRHARKLEKELGRDIFCPIALDASWKSSKWPERVMEQIMEYNILDFSGWKEKSTFDFLFAKLLSGLEIFYKGSEK